MLREHEVVGVQRPRDALPCCSAATSRRILGDIMMPQMTGMEFYEERLVHNRLVHSPELARRIVFTTGEP